jgi:glycosyltransferase involved in cell wall biosynthesis
MASRCDLHVHSKYSDRPSEWILRRIGAPECFTDPQTVYEMARRRGMQFVTLTDHNCIQGALEIAPHKNVFISTELTTYFPEDQCKVHVLAWDITEQQFRDLQELRANIYELRDYLVQEKVVHSCAHPLYSINDKLTLTHFEKLLVLFNVFEVMNGGRNKRGNILVAAILRCLTREDLELMADRHSLEPKGDQPWHKGMTGGSDDHSGVFIAKGYTECPEVADFQGFLHHVTERQSNAGGLHGTALSLAHSFYSIGYHYYRDKYIHRVGNGNALRQVLGEIVGPEQTRVRFRDKVTHLAKKITRRKTRPSELEFKRMITEEMQELFSQEWQKDDLVLNEERYHAINQRTFDLASRISNQLLFQFSKRFIKKLSRGSIFGSLEAVSALGPVLFSVAPYLFSYAHQHRDRNLLAEVSQRFFGDYPELKSPVKKAWFSDTLAEVNGVAVLVQKMGKLAKEFKHDLTLISLAGIPPSVEGNVHNFLPVGEFKLPENESITLGFPPFLEMLDYCERQEFTEFIISTPAPLGLAALAVGKMLGLRLSGIYHTDLPQYIRYYTEDEEMEGLTWQYLRWFYDQMDHIYVPSKVYLDQLASKGFHPAKLRLFPHGADVDAFHPRFRDPVFWEGYGGNGRTQITYVGRVAKEKDLDILVEVYSKLAKHHPECQLAVVGDGPYLKTMKEKLRPTGTFFTGFLHGEELSKAYASSDVFLFPSTTDTFGNVIVEAMASGVPVVVSDKGGSA